jgi:hypothetical protein
MAESQTATPRKQAIKTVDGALIAQGIYKATFKDGTVFEADISKVTAEMQARFTQYGLKQKLDDSMAGAESVEEAIEEVKSTWDAIVAGNWTIRVAGEGVEGGLFARAYAKRHNVPLADAKAKIGGLVEKNVKANQELNKGKENAPEVTDRMVFNRLRDTMLERDAELATTYEALRAERAKKSKGKTSGVQISLEE